MVDDFSRYTTFLQGLVKNNNKKIIGVFNLKLTFACPKKKAKNKTAKIDFFGYIF